MPSEKSESKEVLINSFTEDVREKPKIVKTDTNVEHSFIEGAIYDNWLRNRYHDHLYWTNSWTRSSLRVQLSAICILPWILVSIYGSNLPVKTALSTDLVPLWSVWVTAIYALSLCVGYSFHFYPSCLGILISAILQLITLAFSSYFEFITLTAMEENGRLDKNDATRAWGAFLYSIVFAANGAIICSSFILTFASFRDVCGKAKMRHNVSTLNFNGINSSINV